MNETLSGDELRRRVKASPARGTLVNAWASWCGPCKREFPMLHGLRSALEEKSIDLLFISVDSPESHAAAEIFFRENGENGPIYFAERPLGKFKKQMNPEWPGMLPATFLFDEQGELRFFWGGPAYEKELMPIIDGFLAGEQIDGSANFGLSPGKDLR
ncbi:MAG: TlpA family protein disulfide reductase [Polyangiaceae bacterium]|nr:TlpA family protein disulfide reductase [Polyangiaceae bacterium]